MLSLPSSLLVSVAVNKVFHRPVPAAQEIRDIDAAGLYGGHPKNLGIYIFVMIYIFGSFRINIFCVGMAGNKCTWVRKMNQNPAFNRYFFFWRIIFNF